MFLYLIILFCSFVNTEARHFDGGTITWAPIDPYDNSSNVPITITQSYSWAYPVITCANNVPITTSGRSTQNWNLTCVADCSTDGGYSTKPIDILTDCTSVNPSLGMMSSSRSHNLTLTAGAYFYLANVGSAWVALNDPPQSGLEWSIVTLIDLRIRPDGFINTPPAASVVSPQYAFVNQTIQINIPVSDVNTGDDVRCQWATYTAGYRRRRSNEEASEAHQSAIQSYKKVAEDGEIIRIRKKRDCSACYGGCPQGCDCTCNACDSSVCTSTTCTSFFGCQTVPTTSSWTWPSTSSWTWPTTTSWTWPTTTGLTYSTTSTTLSSTTLSSTTTVDTPGTLKSTSSYPNQQAIDECGDICYPGSLPNGTSMANCTISFTGLTAGVWYAAAVQVEDFINDTSTTPMSSVPVQFLIYVLPQPTCSNKPIIFPLDGCLEVEVGVSVSFNISAMNLCDPSVATLSTIVVSSGINGMTNGNLITSTTNSSISYVTFTWTPLANQVGSQQLCTIAYTSELLQSDQYCVVFTVKNSSDICVTTTTTSTTTTTESTTTSSTSTSATTSTTSETTSTSSTSTSTTSTSTSTTTSTTSTTSTTTSTTSTSTSTTTSTTSTTSTTTSTTSTSTTTTATSVTTTTATTVTTTTVTTTETPKASTNWLLILGLSLLALLLAICCSCCCLYWLLWGPAARRRRQKQVKKDDVGQENFVYRNLADLTRTRGAIDRLYQRRIFSRDHPVDNILTARDRMTSHSPSDMRISFSKSSTVLTTLEECRASATVSVKYVSRSGIEKVNIIEKPNGIKNAQMKTLNNSNGHGNTSANPRSAASVVRVNRMPSMDDTDPTNLNTNRQKTSSAISTISKKTSQVNATKVSRIKSTKIQRPRASSFANVSVIHVDISSIEMQPLSNRAKTSMSAADRKANTGNSVTVKRVSRKLSTSESVPT